MQFNWVLLILGIPINKCSIKAIKQTVILLPPTTLHNYTYTLESVLVTGRSIT